MQCKQAVKEFRQKAASHVVQLFSTELSLLLHTPQQRLTMLLPSQSPLPVGDLDPPPHLAHCSLGPLESAPSPNGISIGSAVCFAEHIRVSRATSAVKQPKITLMCEHRSRFWVQNSTQPGYPVLFFFFFLHRLMPSLFTLFWKILILLLCNWFFSGRLPNFGSRPNTMGGKFPSVRPSTKFLRFRWNLVHR